MVDFSREKRLRGGLSYFFAILCSISPSRRCEGRWNDRGAERTKERSCSHHLPLCRSLCVSSLCFSPSPARSPALLRVRCGCGCGCGAVVVVALRPPCRRFSASISWASPVASVLHRSLLSLPTSVASRTSSRSVHQARSLSLSHSFVRLFTHSLNSRYGVTVVVGWFQEPEEGPVPCRNARQQGEDRRRRRVHAASASYSADPRAQRLLARYAVEHYLTTSQPLPLQPLSEIVHHLAQRTRQRKKRSTVC